jgi:hypothetical protein
MNKIFLIPIIIISFFIGEIIGYNICERSWNNFCKNELLPSISNKLSITKEVNKDSSQLKDIHQCIYCGKIINYEVIDNNTVTFNAFDNNLGDVCKNGEGRWIGWCKSCAVFNKKLFGDKK